MVERVIGERGVAGVSTFGFVAPGVVGGAVDRSGATRGRTGGADGIDAAPLVELYAGCGKLRVERGAMARFSLCDGSLILTRRTSFHQFIRSYTIHLIRAKSTLAYTPANHTSLVYPQYAEKILQHL